MLLDADGDGGSKDGMRRLARAAQPWPVGFRQARRGAVSMLRRPCDVLVAQQQNRAWSTISAIRNRHLLEKGSRRARPILPIVAKRERRLSRAVARIRHSQIS